MTTTFDAAEVRRFAEGLNAQMRACDNGEGTVCATLDAKIARYAQWGQELRQLIYDWAKAVFAGQITFEQETESSFKMAIEDFLRHAKPAAALGRAMCEGCFTLEGLDLLHRKLAELDFLHANWVSPRRAVSPAPRVRLPDATARKAAERAKNLPVGQ